ncbi:hypothetical protein ACIBG5_40965 [Kribbella sp. NPDC050241]|uniref:hypothetical protein n=1 Tax=Kribbella sp. NPDC050241 TaxID=3364115 RepID=UPI003799E7C8
MVLRGRPFGNHLAAGCCNGRSRGPLGRENPAMRGSAVALGALAAVAPVLGYWWGRDF